MSEQQNIMPATLVGGESLSVNVSLADYSPDDGWSLTYRFGGQPDTLTTDGEDAGDGTWDVALTAAQTLTLLSGLMRFDALVWNDDESIAVDSGSIAVTASPLLVSQWKAVLTSVEAAIASWGTSDQRSVSIEGMDITFRTIGELMKLRAFCIRQIGRETGNRRPSIIRARFT